MRSSPVNGGNMQTSRLLALPGELRNRIYELAAEDMSSDPITLLERRRALWNHRISPTDCYDWSTFKRCFLGLTQVCHKIRQEFLPIHERHFEARIHLNELHDYLNAIVPASGGRISNGEPKIRVYVDLSRVGMVSIRELILFRSTFTDLDLEMRTDPNIRASNSLKQLLFGKDNTEWWVYLTQCVTRVEVHTYQGRRPVRTASGTQPRIQISIYVKPECAEGWMWDVGYNQEKARWENKTGVVVKAPLRVYPEELLG